MTAGTSWFWDVRRSEKNIREILRNPSHKSFIHYASLLLARSNVPKEVFRRFLSKKNFCLYWQVIKRRMRKDKWNLDRVAFWDEIYRHVWTDFKAKGVVLKPVKERRKIGALEQNAAKLIKMLRQMNRMTQRELAEKAGVTQQVISKIESGAANPSLRTIEKINQHLGDKLELRIEKK